MIKTRVTFQSVQVDRSALLSLQNDSMCINSFTSHWEILPSPHFPFYGNRGHHKSLIFFFCSRGVLQLRRGPVTAEICIRSCGAAVCANYSPSSRASLTNTSPQTRAGGAGPRWGGCHPIGGRSVWRTGEKTPGKETEPPDARCNGTRRSSCA